MYRVCMEIFFFLFWESNENTSILLCWHEEEGFKMLQQGIHTEFTVPCQQNQVKCDTAKQRIPARWFSFTLQSCVAGRTVPLCLCALESTTTFP